MSYKDYSKQLKACPLCGGTDLLITEKWGDQNPVYHKVECDCGISYFPFSTESTFKRTIEMWNNRKQCQSIYQMKK